MIADLLRVNQLAYELYKQHVAEVATYIHSRQLHPSFRTNGQSLSLGYAPPGNKLLQQIKKTGDPSLLEAALDVGLIKKSDDGRLYDFFRERLMIPILTGSDIIGFGGRVIDVNSAHSKYINSQESQLFDKSGALFCVDPVNSICDLTLVVEGYMDAITVAKNGFGAGAGMGTALTTRQLAAALDMGKPVVLLFDGDAAGQKAAKKAAITALSEISPSRKVEVCLLYDGFDPDEFIHEFGAEALLTHIGLNSVDVVDFVVHSDSEDIDQSIRHYTSILEIIRSTKNPYAANAVAQRMAAGYPSEMVGELAETSHQDSPVSRCR